MRSVAAAIIISAVSFGTASGLATGAAQAGSLQGTWSGSGSASFGANEERIRCRAKFRRLSASRYSLWARCSNGSSRVTQTARLRKVGANEYEGTFRNAEYGVTGNIYIEVSGSRQNVTLEASNGSADINLRKR